MPEERAFPATAMPDRDWWQALWPDPEGVLRKLRIAAGLIAVDLCCGDGYFTAPLARLTEGRVYAVDLDAEMLRRARAEIECADGADAELIRADARDLPTILPEKVDVVLIANTFHGVPQQTALARAVAAALKPGGRFAVVNWHARPREETTVLGQPRGPRTELRMSPEALRAVVEPAGFTLERLVELPPYHYGAVFTRG
jgi:SAM-dependent methyltransferase